MVTLREKIIVALVSLVAFGGAVAAPFQYDDYGIFADPAITSAGGWLEILASPLQTRPLTYLTFWFNFQTGGQAAWSYHALNLAIHLACCLLLFDALGRQLPSRSAFLASLLFAVHPLQSEAVIYIFARSSMLATLFCLLAWRCWLMERRWWAVAWFVPALLAKEECAAFPLFLALLPGLRANWKQLLAMCALSLAAGLRVIAATKAIAGAGSGFDAGITPVAYLAAQGVAILRYVRLFVIPWGFSVDAALPANLAWVAWPILVVLSVLAWRSPHRFWLIGPLVLLAPSSSIFPAADLSADRRMYLPMIALCAAAALLIDRLQPYWIVGVLVVLSIFRVAVWQSEEALWSEALEQAPQKIRPRLMLARVVAPEKGLLLLEAAKIIEPENAAIYAEMGRIDMQRGRYTGALLNFGKALALKPGDARALNNRGVALQAMGQSEAARADFEAALRVDPCQFDARLNLKRFDAPPGCRYSDEQKRLMGR